MNSDERLNRLLDSVEPPALQQDFYRRLLEETAPETGAGTPPASLLARLFHFPQMPALAASVAALLAGALFLIDPFNGTDSSNLEKFVLDDQDTELLWFSDDEVSDDDEIDRIELIDIGVAELYAIDNGLTEQGF